MKPKRPHVHAVNKPVMKGMSKATIELERYVRGRDKRVGTAGRRVMRNFQ